MTTQRVVGSTGKRWCWMLVGLLGCSGESAVVGGNQAEATGGDNSTGQQNLGKVRRISERIQDEPGLCVPYELPLDADGTAACKIFAFQAGAACACDGPNRAPVTDALRASVLAQAKAGPYPVCDGPDGPACADLCICEDLEASGDALTGCLESESAQVDGWCYVSPTQGIGTSEPCSTEPNARIRFLGGARFSPSERGYIVCSEASKGAVERRPLGAVCVASDEQNPLFSGFQFGEIAVDTGSTSCASGTCLVRGFQGRVSCPFGSAVGGGEGACALPNSNERVLVRVAPQLLSRPPSIASTCSCRCAGPGDGPFCSCGAGQACVELVQDLGLAGDELAGSYCVPRATISDDTRLTCADEPDQCEDREY